MGAVAIGSHPGRRIASPLSGKPRIPPSERKRSMTGPVPRPTLRHHGRRRHYAHRAVPKPARFPRVRAAQPGVHTLQCAVGHTRRPPATGKTRRPLRNSILVLVEGALVLDRPLRQHHPRPRRSSRLHRSRGYFQGTPTAKAAGFELVILAGRMLARSAGSSLRRRRRGSPSRAQSGASSKAAVHAGAWPGVRRCGRVRRPARLEGRRR